MAVRDTVRADGSKGHCLISDSSEGHFSHQIAVRDTVSYQMAVWGTLTADGSEGTVSYQLAVRGLSHIRYQ